MAHQSDPALHVLISLLAEPKHGYAISRDIEALTGRRPGPGTLYGAIARLQSGGLIEQRPSQGRRKPYALTPAGHHAVRDTLDAMDRLAGEGRRRLRARTA